MSNKQIPQNEKRAANPDALTGEPGSHPVATGVGAAATGAAAMAIAGAVAGPVGVAVATVGGALIGGFAGKAAGEVIDPTAEDAYWRENHRYQPFSATDPYDDYAPAYRTGYMGHREGKTFEEREADLKMEYEGDPQKAAAEGHRAKQVRWEKAREAARAAYERVHRGEAARKQSVNTGVSRAVLSQDAQSGTLSSAQMPH
jgi:hypothetical protein